MLACVCLCLLLLAFWGFRIKRYNQKTKPRKGSCAFLSNQPLCVQVYVSLCVLVVRGSIKRWRGALLSRGFLVVGVSVQTKGSAQVKLQGLEWARVNSSQCPPLPSLYPCLRLRASPILGRVPARGKVRFAVPTKWFIKHQEEGCDGCLHEALVTKQAQSQFSIADACEGKQHLLETCVRTNLERLCADCVAQLLHVRSLQLLVHV